MKNRVYIVIAASYCLFSLSSIAHAEIPNKLQQLGRACGVGWGDGYHACRCSGFRPGADLPPEPYCYGNCRNGLCGSGHCGSGHCRLCGPVYEFGAVIGAQAKARPCNCSQCSGATYLHHAVTPQGDTQVDSQIDLSAPSVLGSLDEEPLNLESETLDQETTEDLGSDLGSFDEFLSNSIRHSRSTKHSVLQPSNENTLLSVQIRSVQFVSPKRLPIVR